MKTGPARNNIRQLPLTRGASMPQLSSRERLVDRRLADLEAQVAELLLIVSGGASPVAPGPRTRTARQERENAEAWYRAIMRDKAGDRSAIKHFIAAGGWTPPQEWVDWLLNR